MIKKNLFKYLIAIAIPVIILLGMTIVPMLTVISGQEILLKTRPVDPTDIFRGDYVNLAYEIDEVSIDKFPEEVKNAKRSRPGYDMKSDYEYEYYDFSNVRNKKMYATLKPVGEYYEVDKVTFEKPNGGIYLKCTFPDYFYTPVLRDSKALTLRVNYSMDKYFIPENTGAQLEEASRKGELAAKVKVYKGYAILESVFPAQTTQNQ